MKTVYLSGPMTGLPEYNHPAFNAAASQLRKAGYKVTNPAEINADTTQAYETCLRADIKAMCDCDIIALMPGWEKSKGARLELQIAPQIGMAICQLGDLLPLDFSDGFVELR